MSGAEQDASEEPIAAAALDLQPEILPATSAVDEPRPHERWNFLTLIVYQVLMRTGWIFKTESSIMPAVLDSFAAYGTPASALSWMRGTPPLLNRFCQSVPAVKVGHPLKGH